MGVINLGILVKKIMGKISGAGYIKSTDYATGTTGGTIKLDAAYATDITSGGKLKAKEISSESYAAANDAAFISKATLDNVLEAYEKRIPVRTQLLADDCIANTKKLFTDGTHAFSYDRIVVYDCTSADLIGMGAISMVDFDSTLLPTVTKIGFDVSTGAGSNYIGVIIEDDGITVSSTSFLVVVGEKF